MRSKILVGFMDCEVMAIIQVVIDAPKTRRASQSRSRELAKVFSVEEVNAKWLHKGDQDS
jgi:hypothetical protein